MQAVDLIKYINDPRSLDRQSVSQLQKLVSDFPYFQSGHILLSMASKKWDASVYQQSLKKTAIVTTNRAHLFKLIHDLENSENEVSQAAESEEKVASTLRQAQSSATESTGSVAKSLVADPESSKHELDILKATENATEIFEEKHPDTKSVLDAEQILEREIGKEVVNSFVEKEILKTPEANKQDIKQEQPESFGDWLSFLKKNNGQSYPEIEEQVKRSKSREDGPGKDDAEKAETETRKLKNKAIIDRIIESSPGLIRQKEEQRFYTPDIKAKESLLENEHLVTETLAKIYALQGSISKAIRAYEILGMKFPQKRAHFDSLIQKLKHGNS